MNESLLSIYHHLPGPLRSAAASLRGFHLRNWRFSRLTRQLVEQAREREYSSAKQWNNWQQQRLAYVLNRAATEVPYYRRLWSERRSRGDRSSWQYLENWPILDKESIRANPAAFVADDCSTRQMFKVYTSGTTGKALVLWRSRGTMRELYALSVARSTGWHGLSRKDRWARLGGQLVTPVYRRKPPFWVWNAALNQLYMSAYHLSPDFIPHYLDALIRYRITYLFGYTSSIHALAQEALRLGRRDLKMKVAITYAEPLPDHQRRIIAQAFQCPVRETYGMGEIVTAASECQAGTLHQWPEMGLVEVIEGDSAARSGEPGEFICTGLLNADMPLIRYRVGDSGQSAAEQGNCPCSRPLPSISVISGGSYDLLITRDGRRLFGLDTIVYNMPVRQVQIVQERLDLVRVRYVPAREFTSENGRFLIDQLQARMGRVEVALEPLEEIPRSANGKFSIQVCNIPPAERDLLFKRDNAQGFTPASRRLIAKRL